MEERTNRYVHSKETTAERLAFCDTLDMWDAIAKGEINEFDTIEQGLKIATEHRLDIGTVFSYMKDARQITLHFRELNDS